MKLDRKNKVKLIDYYGNEIPVYQVGDDNGPYLHYVKFVNIRGYNPNYKGNRTCTCGHGYERHFDFYEGDDMAACGCKYCSCRTFKPAKE